MDTAKTSEKQKILHRNAGFVVEHSGFEPVTSAMRIDPGGPCGASGSWGNEDFLHYIP